MGIAGGAVIWSAIVASLDRRSFRPSEPEAAISIADSGDDQSVNPRKGDRILRPFDIASTKRTFHMPVDVKIGDKEVIRDASFTRIDSPLAISSLGYADQIPPFNPLVAAGGAGAASAPPADPGPALDEAEVTFVVKDLSAIPEAVDGQELSIDEVAAQVDESMRASAGSPALPPQLLLMRTSRLAAIDPTGGLTLAGSGPGLASAPFSSIQVRMVPENVTFIPESTVAGPTVGADERMVTVLHGQSLEDALRGAGADPNQCRSAAAAFSSLGGRAPVNEGDRVKLLFSRDEASDAPPRLLRVALYADDSLRASAALDDSGRWMPVQTPAAATAASKTDDDSDDEEATTLRLYDSLYETALKDGLTQDAIAELIRIFGSSVDFQSPVTGGDSFDALFEDRSGGRDFGDILYASVTAHGQTYEYYRFRAEDGSVDYFDPNGRITSRFLVREPLLQARLTSPFGSRLHPILGYTRMHTGVDWAAPTGSPIHAAGDGSVIKAGRVSGYGNRVEIQHADGYVTTYSHMSGFARGIAPGVKVTQGQVIGYLGMTGLATGPHLHYEVVVNGHFVDPLSVKLARTRELSGDMLAKFQKARDRIRNLLAQAPEPRRVAEGDSTAD